MNLGRTGVENLASSQARVPAMIALAVLGVMLVVAIVCTTPWQTLPHVPGGPARISATTDFSSEEIARGQALRSAVRLPAYLSMGLSLAVALLLGLTPLGSRLITAVARPFGGGWVWQVVLGSLAVYSIGALVSLPFSARTETVLRRFGLSTRDWSGWAADQAKAFALGAVLLLVVLLGLYGLIRTMPRFWWIAASAAGALLVIMLSFAYPLLVEPVFNKFTPMSDGPLRSELIRLADADGVPVKDVLVADASRRTTALNAYVSGFGSTRRIVVYDTTVRTAPLRQIEMIAAHELGHAKRADVLHGTLIVAMGLAAAVCLLAVLLGWSPLLHRAGATAAGDPRSLALVLAVVAMLSTIAGPVQMLVSRRIEARADVHALDLTRDPEDFARMQRQLAVSNISDPEPHPIVYGLFSSHPTAPERIAIARDWARIHGVPVPPPMVPGTSSPSP